MVKTSAAAAQRKHDRLIKAAKLRMSSAARTLARHGMAEATIKALVLQAIRDIHAEQRAREQSQHYRSIMMLLRRNQEPHLLTRQRIQNHVKALSSAALGGRGQSTTAQRWKSHGRKVLKRCA